jgi:hypothetical protein
MIHERERVLERVVERLVDIGDDDRGRFGDVRVVSRARTRGAHGDDDDDDDDASSSVDDALRKSNRVRFTTHDI